MLNEFKKYLEDITYASSNQQQKELWNISGVLKNRLNQKLKFDTRPLTKEGFNLGSFKTKADKMVFFIDKWIIVDVEEMHDYIKNKKGKDFYLNDLIKKLDWNIELK